ncbi:hypothetical protein pEaSNUABM13_00071 [Erwinia phage pEa_SNUABM_13]|nr:hypothetical protein pEaSNUABM13_00071 [Erwinia phage pEa_SNUABM_13]QYW03371.1 hypothetical protein pEaSNUABM34_00069 [Erwinia phage pEa_SNUABM_34]QYW03712.1 hypothetical protein pEaSNUABM45_00069 [Erwinia phage pEa_SNUABM_45]QYW04053.1 hypothetical protein pEaSNUABM46_00069 [Erwinia phage pEa_SNUABM_46]QYW05084.1 hypothetical protein pEaSNUABM21_00070 [Erwinia phage pEa_SNUABM_21]QYW05425.1 hypothetical protein pEaSNUABM25_00069 [Erwinia phage pEa_SNUABM_25]
MRNKEKVRRRFLSAGRSLDAISSQVFTSPYSGLAYGSFSLAVGSSFVHIHALDESTVPESDVLYLMKVDAVIRHLKDYIALLTDWADGHARMWLNPEGSAATGCVAYHHDVSHPEKLAFFELSSCSQTFRLQMMTFTHKEYKKHINLLSKIKDHLIRHRFDMDDWMKAITAESARLMDSVNEQ